METDFGWAAVSVLIAIVALFSGWYFYLRPRGRNTVPQGDASVIIDDGSEVGAIVTEATTDGASTGVAAVNVGKKAKVGDITTKVTKASP